MADQDDKLSKRRLNEFEQKLKRLQRELQELKALKRKVSRLRKSEDRTAQREAELTDMIDELAEQSVEDLMVETPEPEPQPQPLSFKCRRQDCGSHDTDQIKVGSRTIVVCRSCKGRYTLHPSKLAKAG